MKILVTSDWHTDAITAGVDRAEDMAVAINETVERAIAEQVDLYLFLGDLCDPDGVRSHRAAALGVLTAARLLRAGIRSRWVVGNHDVIEDGSGSHTLAGIAAMGHALGGFAGLVVANDEPGWELLYEGPAGERKAGCVLVSLPFTPRSHAYDPAKFIEELPDFKAPVIIAGHLNIEGIGPGSETVDMPRGRDVFWPVEAIRKRWPRALMLAGHYHTRQIFDGIVVVGALERLTFGEQENEPGYVVVDV